MNNIARERMNALTAWLTANKGQQHWSLAETSKDFHRRVDGYNTPRGMVLVVTTQMGDNVTWSVFGEAGAGLPHAERLEALNGILKPQPESPGESGGFKKLVQELSKVVMDSGSEDQLTTVTRCGHRPSELQLVDARATGYGMAKKGVPITDNPCDHEDTRSQWNEGWREFHAKAQPAVEASPEAVPDHSSCIPFSTPVAAPKAKGVLF